MDIIKYSEQLLFYVKTEKKYSSILELFRKISFDDLIRMLNDDNKKKTFWINIYNAFFQILRRDQKIDKKLIYKSKLIPFSSNKLSLDDIEHGILRKYRYKYSLGYLPNIFSPKIIKELAVDKLDYRIHFALNCGAESCPPIAFYKLSIIDKQLNMATESFLEGDVIVDDSNRIVKVSQLFKWFWFDFNGKKGIYKIIEDILDKDVDGYSIQFNNYSWEDDLNNYANY